MGIVYILLNRAMPDVIKIGKTENSIESRIKSLDTTGIPLPFECYYAAEVQDHHSVEKKLHTAFRDKRVRDSREFFYVDPGQAKAALSLAEIIDVTPREGIFTEPDDERALERDSKRLSNFTFSSAKVPLGSTLNFIKDELITSKVLSDTTVEFDGEELSLSRAGLLAIKKCGYNWTSVQGPRYWLYQDETLSWHRAKQEMNEDFRQ